MLQGGRKSYQGEGDCKEVRRFKLTLERNEQKKFVAASEPSRHDSTATNNDQSRRLFLVGGAF
jgi:hypothetical protein